MMFRLVLAAAFIAVSAGERVNTPFGTLQSQTENQYKANKAKAKLRQRMFREDKQPVTNPSSFGDFEEFSNAQGFAPAETPRFAEKSDLAEEAMTSMEAALAVDHKMYGGKTFVPQPGHEMHFDFDGFHKFSQAQVAEARHQIDQMNFLETTEERVNEQGEVTLVQKFFLQTCLEINICTIMPDPPGAPNICGMFGFDGIIEYEKDTSTSKGKLSIKVGLNAGISWGSTGVFTMTVYLFGEAAFEFETDASYTNVYDALVGAVKSMITNFVNTRKLNSKFMARAADCRDGAIADATDPVPDSLAPQIDELKGMVEVHNIILLEYYNGLSSAADKSVASAQKILHQAVFHAVWDPSDARITARKGATNMQMGNLESILVDDDLKCTKLNTAATAAVRKTITPLGMDNVLYCSMLKYCIMCESGEAKRGGFFKTGSRANAGNSIKHLFPELNPATAEGVLDILDLLDVWFLAYSAVLDPSDWTKTQTLTETVKSTKTGAVSTFVRISPVDSVAEVNIRDPGALARGMYQALAMPRAELEKRLEGAYALTGPTFVLSKVVLAGGLGVTLGTSRVGYCTADSNWFQSRLTYQREWTPTAGWTKKGAINLWLVGSTGAFFRVEITIGLRAVDADNPPFKIKFVGTLPNCNGGATDCSDVTADASSASTAGAITSAAEYGAALVGDLYTNVKKAADRKLKFEAFKSSAKAMMSEGRLKGLAAKLPEPQKTSVTAELSKTDVAKKVAASVFKLGIQVGIDALMKLSPLTTSTQVTFAVEWEMISKTKHNIIGEMATVRVNKLSLASNAFYLITGSSISANKEITGLAALPVVPA